jgi:deoxycytidylate deaminase
VSIQSDQGQAPICDITSNLGGSSQNTSAEHDALPSESTDPLPIELVFGFVGPTGVNLESAIAALEAQLVAVGYESKIISLSEIILTFRDEHFSDEYVRIKKLMDMGNLLREKSQEAAIVAHMGVIAIRELREKTSGSPNTPHKTKRIAYIIRSFKRPEEVDLYRDIYGKAFTLISVYAPRGVRISNLAKRCQSSSTDQISAEQNALELINRDNREEGEKYGQRVGKTFPLADFFVTSDTRASMDRQLCRLVRLTFGDPYISPTRDEQGMFFAQAAALRSLDLSRQVGAAITSTEGEIISTGCNEVPKAGGGLYWGEDENCVRDYEMGFDSNVTIKTDLLEDAVRRLRDAKWKAPGIKGLSNREIAEESLFGKAPFFKDSRLFDVIEFGRAVHAEMAAITQAAKIGQSIRDARLFSTTFPCHICARHIVSSGIKEVVFIEPYEKSRTSQLFSDSISIEPDELSAKRVNFRAFVGAAPRRYMDFFQTVSTRKEDDGRVVSANTIARHPKIKRIVFAYVYVEEKIIDQLAPALAKIGAPS